MVDTSILNFVQTLTAGTLDGSSEVEDHDIEDSVIPLFAALVQEPAPNADSQLRLFGAPRKSQAGLSVSNLYFKNDFANPELALQLELNSPVNAIANKPELVTSIAQSQATTLEGKSSVAGSTMSRFGPSIVKQTANVIQTELLSSNDSTQSITVRLSPNNLGALHIQIDVFPEQVAAHILATELSTADLLSRGKDSLEDLLTDFGFDGASVDVSHGSLPKDSGSRKNDDGIAEDGVNGSTTENESNANKTVSIFVGLNLVA